MWVLPRTTPTHKHTVIAPGGPLTYFNDRGSVQVIFLGLKFWPKVIFLGLWKMTGIFWVAKNKTEGFFWVVKKELRDFLGYVKKVVIFLGRQILKLWFFGYKIWISVRPRHHKNLWVGPLGWYQWQQRLSVRNVDWQQCNSDDNDNTLTLLCTLMWQWWQLTALWQWWH